MKCEPIEIESVNPDNLLRTLDAVRGCWKATSVVWMHAMRLPVLPGLIVPKWSRQTAALVREFCARARYSEVLLRIDKSGQRWTRRRGGYLVRVADIDGVMKDLSREGMIAILLEPASPYTDSYSLGGVAIPDEERVVIEVVGPGFDASDILRSDVQPHERFEVCLSYNRWRLDTSDPRNCKRTYLIDSSTYQRTVKQRLTKIGARLENIAFPDAVLGSGRADREQLARRAQAFLKKTGQTLLLEHAASYSPIPRGQLAAFAARVSSLVRRLAGYGIHLGTISVSASFITNRRLVFWDFFPAKMRDTAILTRKARL